MSNNRTATILSIAVPLIFATRPSPPITISHINVCTSKFILAINCSTNIISREVTPSHLWFTQATVLNSCPTNHAGISITSESIILPREQIISITTLSSRSTNYIFAPMTSHPILEWVIPPYGQVTQFTVLAPETIATPPTQLFILLHQQIFQPIWLVSKKKH